MTQISPLMIGFQGTEFSQDELQFFKDVNPYGLMVMRRNVLGRNQIKRLNDQFRDAVGRDDAVITTDQEGGRIQHLEGPDWPTYPIYAAFKKLIDKDFELAKQVVRRSSRALASDMATAGFNANCGPVLDLSFAGASAVISDRSFGERADIAAHMGEQIIAGFMESGIIPMMKHIPGHGRAAEDSHVERPVVSESLAILDNSDFLPFKTLNQCPWAMVSHVVYAACDDLPASISKPVVDDIIRKRIGFDGVLISDCVYMQSLEGDIADRCQQVQNAGVDLVLSCHGGAKDWYEWDEKLQPLTDDSLARLSQAQYKMDAVVKNIDPDPHATMQDVWRILKD
ncbi:MAG: beta-N-acetylhexosaminidase [Rhizobiales bacterium]|nr:beta-N-acetylhexosaminidase [Hyphomicrobiales bacterium]NRB13497.1 beta-N-acetylhexosaminidase [Hyphomicrobiales bacterium]